MKLVATVFLFNIGVASCLVAEDRIVALSQTTHSGVTIHLYQFRLH